MPVLNEHARSHSVLNLCSTYFDGHLIFIMLFRHQSSLTRRVRSTPATEYLHNDGSLPEVKITDALAIETTLLLDNITATG